MRSSLVRLLLAFALAVFVGGCDDGGGESEQGSGEPPGRQTQRSAEPAEPSPPPEPEPAPEPPPPPDGGETDLDSMSEAQLEAACFEGDQAACDRLGH